MKNKRITWDISQGMYVLTTVGAGCCVDAVSQISAGEEPLIAVAVMKQNYTNEVLHQQNRFAISVLGLDVDPEIIRTFGFHSMRDYDKFAHAKTELVEGLPILPDALGYMILEKVDTIENETHTLFIGKMVEGDKFKAVEPMTYGYYQKHKEELMQIKTVAGKTLWVCDVCGYVYEGEELPADFTCPICHVGPEHFHRK